MISMFKRKNPEELKPLTEEDIQRKLYGSYVTGKEMPAKPGKGRGDKKGLAGHLGKTPAVTLRHLPRVEDPEAVGIETEAKDLFEVRTTEKISQASSLRESKDVLSELNENLRRKDLTRSATSVVQAPQPDEIRSEDTFSFSWREELGPILEGILNTVRGLPWGWIAGSVGLIVAVLIGWNVVRWVGSKSAEIQPLAPVSAKSVPAAAVQTTHPAENEKTVLQASSFPQYTVQVCVYESLAQAKALINQLKQQGLEAFYDSSQTKKGKTVYRVYVGRFATVTEAQDGLQKLQSAKSLKAFPDSFVKKMSR